MTRRARKQNLIRILSRPDLDQVLELVAREPCRSLINPLFSCLCHPEEIIRWHAVSVFGRVVPELAELELEAARVVMRRFLWMLNDESGGIGWGVPEAMGEVMFHHRKLAAEYSHMLVSYTLDDGPELYQDGNFLELPGIQRGVLWGLCRLASGDRQRLLEHRAEANLEPYLASTDPAVRGLACCLADLLGAAVRYRQALDGLSTDPAGFTVYFEGDFFDYTVGAAAIDALRPRRREWFRPI